MKFWLLAFSLAFLAGCNGKRGSDKASISEADTISVPDTGFTGIVKGTSGKYLVNEVTLKNGVREGLTKTFYVSGKLRSTKWYRNGLLQDSVAWFYEEGQLFRLTPYKNDTVDGVQKQFYRTGQLKARLGFSKGLRTSLFQEFTRDGKLVTGYPEIKVSSTDNYNSGGIYKIRLELSDKKKDVKFFRGEFTNGLYDTTRIKKIPVKNNIGYLDLKKTGAPGQSYVGVIAEILTDFGNRRLVYKKIELPYSDLN